MKFLRLLSFLPLMLVLAGASGTALADPPARAGRLSVVEGEVALRRDGSRDWVRAGVNLPVTTGDELATQPDARAEVRIGSSVLRLDQATSIEVRRLDDERIRVFLKEGSVALRIRSSDREDAIAVETRDGVALPADPGVYRVDFLDSATLVSNHRGYIDFRTADRNVGVTEGRRAQIWNAGPTDVQWDDPDEDRFMQWSLARDRRDDRLARKRYVSPEMTGVEDLYEYGDWREYDDYGAVWFPRSMPYGWAPYRYGHWVSIAPWGWTWVDDAPWGFAPFHYGRWVRIRGAWAWAPGRYIARPVYAPALVAWIGTPGVSITYSSGLPDVGWFPLAPREVYVPYYSYSPTYVRQVNITQVTNVVEIDRVVRAPQQVRYAFRDRREAVTRVSERILRAPAPVTLDVESRRENRFREWERRGFPVREVVRPDGTRERTVQPAALMQQRGDQAVREQRPDERQRLDPRQERIEALRQQQVREREERAAREPEQQRQRLFQRDQQNARDRDEQARREAAQQEEQRRQRSTVRERLEQRRDEAGRAQREDVDPRRDERMQRLEALRRQEAGEREERNRQQAQQAQEQERRRDVLRQQQIEQREREVQQRQQDASEREARRQQFEQQREERSRQQAMQEQEQERRRNAIRQQVEQRERDVQQQRQMQIQQQQQQQRQAEQQQAERQQQRQVERMQRREAVQQDNSRGGEEEPQPRRRRPFGQDGDRP